MRVGGGRCSPLLVGGLLIACLMLICNWWTLSSENFDLVHQIDELSEQLKISAEENDQCITLRSKLEQRYKHVEDEVAYLHVSLEKQNEFNKKQKEEFENSIAICKSELDSNKMDVKRKENEKLQEELDRVKDEMEKLKLAYKAPVDNIRPDPALTPKRNSILESSTIEGMRNDKTEKIDISNEENVAAETISYVEKRNNQLTH